jgi:hypothetical protein
MAGAIGTQIFGVWDIPSTAPPPSNVDWKERMEDPIQSMSNHMKHKNNPPEAELSSGVGRKTGWDAWADLL